MSLVVVGCNHRSTPLGLLERMTVAPDDLPKALHDLATAEHLSESVLLSTCNRIEVYAYAERFHGGYADIRELIARHSGLPPEIVGDELYAHHDADAVRHLFAVAAGLDSVVVGEHEVLGQVRDAWQAARTEGTVGAVLEPLFRRAVETGKRARTETGISRGIASLSHAAVALAAELLGGLAGRRVLVLGAGEVAAGTLKSLADAGPADIAVASRSPERAVAAAQLCGGRAVALAELDTALASADVAITTTGATEIVLEHSDIDAVMARRAGAELLIVDVAVPRDVDPAARELPGVRLLDMDDLGDFVERERSGRTQETDSVQAIIDEEVEFYLAEASAREVAPLIAALRGRAELLSASELERHASRLADLSPAQRAAVESLLRGVVNKLLHEPTVRLKDAAGHARGDRLAEALRDLFDL
ncbi:MAG: glutamyl-tRNA reductase [Acidimicrobiaceae bacterium]|nr:glutamyl-tRNA reductase [Acidimicrobiaceae bacterium]MCY3650744.1 glutamyl-tRNA reductase [Acidimicrobiaceae bacterium]MDE0516589.1 glutamyl-tRNA reductase [Acidimicrobiaceae bacterium]MDE0655962.1 glutamyl-tRNA reductase [Acidimicrobiaceae bacterium]MXZ94308.1 glutamyl-tRNA reductase [Acidimicrobiaceae bacterium]